MSYYVIYSLSLDSVNKVLVNSTKITCKEIYKHTTQLKNLAFSNHKSKQTKNLKMIWTA